MCAPPIQLREGGRCAGLQRNFHQEKIDPVVIGLSVPAHVGTKDHQLPIVAHVGVRLFQ